MLLNEIGVSCFVQGGKKMGLMVLLRFLIFIFVFIFVILTILPVLDLPLATSVPVYIWLLLAGLDVVLIISLCRRKKTRYTTGLILAGFIIVAFLAVAASQFYAATPPIAGDNSIAVLEKVQLGGTGQWITIRGKDINKPVLLYLGIGGPGAGGFPATELNLKPLEEHFVVVNWDQPGTGKSYGAVPIETLTVNKFVTDAHELTLLMEERFHQDKIYVMGLSWGTILGTKLVQQYPGDYYAYIGIGQMVNTTENDQMGYRLALKLVEEKGDYKLLDRLTAYGEPPYTGDGMAIKYAVYNNVLFDYMGSANLQTVLLLVPQFAREYGLVDKINFARGLAESFAVVYPQLQGLDFAVEAPNMEVPMYFLVGRRDVNAMASLVEEYYNILQAPYKELIWMESGHGATSGDILDTMINHVMVNSPPR
jgi:pimeloyl-ACP methyl ester carboxylesterase